jgi:aminocarboxymuconate-semialdehyde decarboxylase
MLIDIHTHLIPRAWLADVEKRGGVSSLTVEGGSTAQPAIHTAGVTFRLSSGFIEPASALERMNRAGIDAQVISPPTFLFHYSDDAARAVELSRIINDAYAETAGRFPGRFLSMGTVPLQDIDLACRELVRVATDLGMRAVEIGTFVNGMHLGDLRLRPFFAEAARLGIFVFVHPLTQSQVAEDALEFAYLRNLVGIPLSTAFAVESVIFQGLLEQLPSLRIGFAHGGGTSSVLVDRWDRSWRANRANLPLPQRSPGELYRTLYFDTVMHAPEALELLFSRTDPNRIMLGSDFPADMGTGSFPGAVASTALYASEKVAQLRGLTAKSLFAIQ